MLLPEAEAKCKVATILKVREYCKNSANESLRKRAALQKWKDNEFGNFLACVFCLIYIFGTCVELICVISTAAK